MNNHLKLTRLLLFIVMMSATTLINAQNVNIQGKKTRPAAKATDVKHRIQHVHPLVWWAGMRDPHLQIMVHGDNISDLEVSLKGATNVTLERVEKVENPNYLFLYLNTEGAPAQTFDICIGKHKHIYELREREQLRLTDAQGKPQTFDSSDVVYLLMPDRFANGDPSNDVVEGMRETQCDVNVPMARHGGDIAGMMDHLDYLADLGVTAIWPTPLLENDMDKESYHGYAITAYYQVDRRFGRNSDYKKFVQAAHARNIKVVKDIVFNHCGSQNFLFTDMPAKDWFNYQGQYVQSLYRTGSAADAHGSVYDREHTIDGWFVPTMPDLNQRNPLVRDYLIQASLWWVEFAGIDGFRQDTYPYNDFDAMRAWCERLELEYPGFNTVGEVWINNNVGVSYWQKDSKLAAPKNSLLPTVMDFPLMALLNSVVDEETDDWNSGFARLYEYLSQDMVYADPNHLLTFLDNHDTDRFQKNAEMANDTVRYKQALTLLLTLRGIPQVYYGDEIGMAADKSKGDGALRQDFPGGWPEDKHDCFTKAGRNDLQNWYFNFTRNLLQWRKTSRAVHYGKLVHFCVRDGVYVYARVLGGEVVTVVLNGTSKHKTIDLTPYREVLPAAQAENVLTHRTVKIGETMALQPKEVRVLSFGH